MTDKELKLTRLFAEPTPNLQERQRVTKFVLENEGYRDSADTVVSLLGANDPYWLDLAYTGSYCSTNNALRMELQEHFSDPRLIELIIETAYSPRTERLALYRGGSSSKDASPRDIEHGEALDILASEPYNAADEMVSIEMNKEHRQTPVEGLDFPDEATREAWEITQAISDLLDQFPEEMDIDFQPVSFEKEFYNKGWHAILTAGTVMGSGNQGIVFIPKRTRDILERLKIPFRMIPLEEIS